MTTIYSGLFVHEHGYYPTEWTSRAIKRQQQYCDHWGFDYKMLTEIPWGLKYPLRHAWSFGTTIKFVALDMFLKSNEKFFTWFDLDVYPTDRAFEYILPTRCNLLYAPFVEWGFSDQPGHDHMRCKREWCGHKTDYFALNTGMFRLDRKTVQNLWEYLNKLLDIRSEEWWAAHYEKQLSFSKGKPWLYGSEEAIMEEWLNQREIEFQQLSEEIHSVHSEHNPIFMHYYGPTKSKYP